MKKLTLLFIAFILIQPITTLAQAGLLDPSFNGNGIVVTDMGATYDQAYSVVVQTDGKIVVAGENVLALPNDYQFALARHLTNGSLDNSFGTGGKVFTNLDVTFDGARSVAIDGNGRIIVAGYTVEGTQNYNFALVRYDSTGALDLSFNSTGKVITDFGGEDGIKAIALQVDEKIIAVGWCGSNDFAVARYNTDGSLDTTFDTDGKVTTDFFSLDDASWSVALQSDGKIVVGGFAYSTIGGYDFALTRYDTTGALDTTFDADGKVQIDIDSTSDYGSSLVIQADGKILLGGDYIYNSQRDFAIVRINSDGSRDSSFGLNGIATFDFYGDDDYCTAIALQSNGKILMSGVQAQSITYQIALLRLNNNGTLDTPFGKVITAINNRDASSLAMTIQPDDKIIVVGDAVDTINLSNQNFGVVRYLANLSLGLLDFSKSLQLVSVYPNPLSNNAVLEYDLANDEKITITLNDVNGKTVKTFIKDAQRHSGNCKEVLQFDNSVAPGMYVVSIANARTKNVLSVKIVVK